MTSSDALFALAPDTTAETAESPTLAAAAYKQPDNTIPPNKTQGSKVAIPYFFQLCDRPLAIGEGE